MHQNPPINNIRIIKLVNGDDLVAELAKDQLAEKSPLLRVVKPLQIKYVPQFTAMGLRDYIALIKWAAYTPDTIISIPKDKIMTITNASVQMSTSYNNIIKDYDKLDTPKQKGYERKHLSDEDNQKLNEIFEELEDEYGEIIDKRTLH